MYILSIITASAMDNYLLTSSYYIDPHTDVASTPDRQPFPELAAPNMFKGQDSNGAAVKGSISYLDIVSWINYLDIVSWIGLLDIAS